MNGPGGRGVLLVVAGAVLALAIWFWIPSETPSPSAPLLPRHGGEASRGERAGEPGLDSGMESSREDALEEQAVSPPAESEEPASGRSLVIEAAPLPPLENLSLAELQELLEVRTYPLYESRFAAGLFEVLHQPVDEIEIPAGKLLAMRFAPDGVSVERTVLPEEEYPEEYALQREIELRRECLRPKQR